MITIIIMKSGRVRDRQWRMSTCLSEHSWCLLLLVSSGVKYLKIYDDDDDEDVVHNNDHDIIMMVKLSHRIYDDDDDDVVHDNYHDIIMIMT